MLGALLVNNKEFENLVSQNLNFDLPVVGSILYKQSDTSFGGFVFYKETDYLIGVTYGKGKWLTSAILRRMIAYPFESLGAKEVRARIFKDNKKALMLAQRYFGIVLQETGSFIYYSFNRHCLRLAYDYGFDNHVLRRYGRKKCA